MITKGFRTYVLMSPHVPKFERSVTVLYLSSMYYFFDKGALLTHIQPTAQQQIENFRIHNVNNYYIHQVQHIQKLEPEYDWSEVERELAERRETVHEACYNSPKPKPKPNAWEFVIDARHSLIWCNVFKSASSSWMHNFNVLGIYKNVNLVLQFKK